ncbi:MAG: PcfB family protein, partial [Eubacteriales bacterium]
MSNGGEAADQIVNMSLRGIEVLAKISGAGAKNLAVYLYAVLKGQKKTKGKTRLEGLLRSGKELKVFAVKNEDLQKFTQEAKRYGVLYCALRDKKSIDGMCDIMVRVEDASKINRIVERFKLATVDTASIKSDIQKTRAEKQTEKGTPAEKSADDFLDDLLEKTGEPEPEIPQVGNPNPTVAKMEKSRPSEPMYGRSVN